MDRIPRYRITSRAILAVAIGLLIGPSAAQAQGFGIYEHDACAMGRAGTGVARPCPGGPAMFFNPAALGALPRAPTASSDEELLDQMMNPPKEYRTFINLGLTLIVPLGSFTDDIFGVETDQDGKVIPVPNLYVTHRFNEALSAGLGVFGAFGLETHWPLDFQGRFGGYDNLLQSIYIQPTVLVEGPQLRTARALGISGSGHPQSGGDGAALRAPPFLIETPYRDSLATPWL